MSAPSFTPDLVERLRSARLFRGDRMVEMPETLRDEAANRIAALTEALEQIAETPNAGWIIARVALGKARGEPSDENEGGSNV